MSGGMVKVTEVLAGYAFAGKVYGPFKGSKDKPFLEVPEALASALNLPLHESEVQAREEAAQAQAAEGGADVEQLLQANHSLKADLDRVTKERDELRQELRGHLTNSAQSVTRLQAERDGLIKRVQDAEGEKNGLHEEIRKLTAENESLRQANQDFADRAIANAPAEQPQGGTPLPDTVPLRDLLTEHGFDTFEKLEAGLVVAEGQTESPVRQLDGVGGKTEDAYKVLVAEWRQGQAN